MTPLKRMRSNPDGLDEVFEAYHELRRVLHFFMEIEDREGRRYLVDPQTRVETSIEETLDMLEW